MAENEVLAFRTIERPKVYAAAVEQILQSIQSGTFPPGSALPAERAMAAQFGVSRSSLREALRVLEHAGVLEARPGSGTYVSSDGGSYESSLRAQAAVAGEHSPLDLMVARAAVEPACAENAARARTEKDLEAMRRHLEEQGRYVQAGLDAEAAEADAQFHLALAVATHNGVLVMMERTIISLMREHAWTRLKARSRHHWGPKFVEHHRLILDAIEHGDSRRAGQLMLMHMTEIETSLIAELGG
ncbi:FadR/GntR family transcriptional regulator [Dactylosporangium sp. NPDC051484]|uniref:FadR/GntR family transcriptional regulator n=1 Tax=Dactylosporangium sp. NPDC051484 TaxID=3154942 RepID=UPI00344CD017